MKKTFLWGAFILSVGAFLSKILGAIYRIPLTNIIGAEGIGLYQMVFPLYSLLLVASSAGIPTAISRMVAEKVASNNYSGAKLTFKAALILMLILGSVASLVIFFFGNNIASLQGNTGATLAYVAISPAIIFSAVISAYRGYFQGRQNMLPSSLSMCVEQATKIVFGLYFASLWLPQGTAYGVMGAVLGVAISEVLAFIVLAIQFSFYAKKDKKTLTFDKSVRYSYHDYRSEIVSVFKVALPITLGCLILPLTLLIDSLFIVNILTKIGYSTSVATALYGLQTGVVNSLINLPAVISLSIATAIVPTLSQSSVKGESENLSTKVKLSIKISWLIALPCFAGILIFSRQIITLLYSGGLSSHVIDEFAIATNLLRLSSISIIYIAFLQVFTATLQALKKSYVPLVNLLIAGTVKIVLNITLISTASINIQGASISNIVCYFIACLLNLIYLRKIINIKINIKQFFILPVLSTLVMAALSYGIFNILNNFLSAHLSMLFAISVGAFVYLVLIIFARVFDSEEKKYIPSLRRIKFYVLICLLWLEFT